MLRDTAYLCVLLPALSAECRACTQREAESFYKARRKLSVLVCISFLPFVNQKGVCGTEACSPVQEDTQSQPHCCMLLGSI